MAEDNRVKLADQLMKDAIEQAEADPRNPVAIARAQSILLLSIAFLLREIIDRGTMEIEIEDEESEEEGPPW